MCYAHDTAKVCMILDQLGEIKSSSTALEKSTHSSTHWDSGGSLGVKVNKVNKDNAQIEVISNSSTADNKQDADCKSFDDSRFERLDPKGCPPLGRKSESSYPTACPVRRVAH